MRNDNKGHVTSLDEEALATVGGGNHGGGGGGGRRRRPKNGQRFAARSPGYAQAGSQQRSFQVNDWGRNNGRRVPRDWTLG